MRRSHRVLVEVTFDTRVTAKLAKIRVRQALERGEIDFCTKFEAKEAERVIQAEIRNRQRVSTATDSGD